MTNHSCQPLDIMNQQLSLVERTCDSCQGQVGLEDNFCRKCGMLAARRHESTPVSRQMVALSPTVPSRPSTSTGVPSTNIPSIAIASTARKLLDNRAFVIFLLACAGPVGLPALWLSGRFSWNVKLITTGLYFLVSAVLPLVFAWYWLETAVRPLADILAPQ